ncbi:hypothetical protein EG829_15185, partial [bacterium]|nr:hypothetical protein [bacterium]
MLRVAVRVHTPWCLREHDARHMPLENRSSETLYAIKTPVLACIGAQRCLTLAYCAEVSFAASHAGLRIDAIVELLAESSEIF